MFPDFNELIKDLFRQDLKRDLEKSSNEKNVVTCNKCNFVNEYAEADLDDETYVCYKCRKGM